MKIKNYIGRLLFYFVVTFIILYCVLPFVWQVLTSFKYDRDISKIPPLVPKIMTLDHYKNVFGFNNFNLYVRNSIVVSVATTFISLLIGSFCSYALARLRFRGKNTILGFTLAASMFPQIAIVSSLYLFFRQLKLINTVFPMIISYLIFTLPLSIWILTSFFKTIPVSVEEAAYIDGCTRFQMYSRILLPLAAPGIFTCGILVFIMAWNEFLFALTFTTSPASQTIPVGIAFFPQMYYVPWGDLAAATVVVTIPLIALVFIFQRKIIYGLTAGAVKE
ncbi:MAG: carbohydrate ABC transporter permease [Candidatus Atribacteria bacterium]|nr:carbohydrate ABC transporter permease [Candidatus Atribacteria bacterium]